MTRHLLDVDATADTSYWSVLCGALVNMTTPMGRPSLGPAVTPYYERADCLKCLTIAVRTGRHPTTLKTSKFKTSKP